MQFEVTRYRMLHELHTPIALAPLPYTTVRQCADTDRGLLDSYAGVEVLTRIDGTLLALFDDRWRLETILRDRPSLTLTEPDPVT